MKINFEEEIKGVDGKTSLVERVDFKQCPNCGFKDGVQVEFGKLTLKSVAVVALSTIFNDEPNLDAIEKQRRGLMAIRIYANPVGVSLKAEDITTIKKLIAKIYNPIVVCRAFEILDQEEPKKDSEPGVNWSFFW